ncbi:unnamed protein product [Mytilus coruscus]|uniref:Apple domain-containing protein n=1 Tax=Mytilus coruscus TaxID=42192 RepID=A0A6J8EHQ8_MYTCO|nr:unnamed protein product [Mytilus coruscus]
MSIAVLSELRIKLISAHHKPEYDNTYEEENAIEDYHVKCLRECVVKCLSNKRCLSFFYNNHEGMCIIHSDPFTYTVMSFSGEGWKFYLFQERAGRCLVNFFYYRELDLCYTLEPPIQGSVVHEDFVCPGTELMRIDSIERQDYIKLVTADIGRVYHYAICIQGKKTQGQWKYNDGSTIEYFRWEPTQPSGSTNVISMSRSKNYNFRILNYGKNCTYMCEYRSQN